MGAIAIYGKHSHNVLYTLYMFMTSLLVMEVHACVVSSMYGLLVYSCLHVSMLLDWLKLISVMCLLFNCLRREVLGWLVDIIDCSCSPISFCVHNTCNS